MDSLMYTSQTIGPTLCAAVGVSLVEYSMLSLKSSSLASVYSSSRAPASCCIVQVN